MLVRTYRDGDRHSPADSTALLNHIRRLRERQEAMVLTGPPVSLAHQRSRMLQTDRAPLSNAGVSTMRPCAVRGLVHGMRRWTALQARGADVGGGVG